MKCSSMSGLVYRLNNKEVIWAATGELIDEPINSLVRERGRGYRQLINAPSARTALRNKSLWEINSLGNTSHETMINVPIAI